MIQIGVDSNLQKEMAKVNSAIDMLKMKHGISVREHLGFGNAANKQLNSSNGKSLLESATPKTNHTAEALASTLVAATSSSDTTTIVVLHLATSSSSSVMVM